MNKHQSDKLLRDILADPELESLREATLKAGLSAMRGRRAERNVLRTVGVICLLSLLGGLFFKQALVKIGREKEVVQKPPPVQEVEQVKFISDEELFALFPNRPLALVGKPGQQQLVFLDRQDEPQRPTPE